MSMAGVASTEALVASLRNTGTVHVAAAGVHATTPVKHAIKAVAASPSTATFIDPTAVIRNPRAITIGTQDYVAPFATLSALQGGTITIGNGSNGQDNVAISALGPRPNALIGYHVSLP